MSAVPDLEYTALETFIEGKDNLKNAGIEFWFSILNESVLSMFKNSGFFDSIGTERMFPDVHTGVEKYLSDYGYKESS